VIDLFVLDVGNSAVKAAAFSGDRAERRAVIGHDRPDAVDALWEFIEGASRSSPAAPVAVSGVLPEVMDSLAAVFHPRRAVLRANVDFRAPIRNTCDPADGVGQDRLFNAAGVVLLGAVPAVVIDAGTAITVDLVEELDGEPTFRGGTIAPGIGLSFQSLNAQTGLLPLVGASAASPIEPLGTNTDAAIKSGVVRGLAGLVDRLVEEVGGATRSDESQRILVTGGDAPLLLPMLRCKPEHDPDLTMKGVAFSVRRCWGGGA